MNKNVKVFLAGLSQWQEELTRLREIILDCHLEENFKWMHPCYTYKNKNIVLIHGFKEYSALLFCKGALLKDPNKILVQQSENVQYGRQIRFDNVKKINLLENTIKNYIKEAVEVERSNQKISLKKVSDYSVPIELKLKFDEDVSFKTAFKNLTPGRQKGYLLYFAKPKQSVTRISRIEKCKKRIFNGKGLNDCVCGLSKRMPNCDGSHKQLLST